MELDVVALFAQVRQRPPQFGGSEILTLVLQCGFGLVGIVVQILYLLNLYQTLDKVAPRNREMEPGLVFLNLIPLFGLVWQFFVVIRLAESLRNEYRDRGWRTADEGFGYGSGLTMAIGACLCCGPVAIVGLIMHWVQMAGYKAKLSKRSKRARDYDDEDEE